MTVDITLNLFWIVLAIVISLALFLLHNCGGVRLFVKKDESIAHKFLDKFPLVSPEFINKSQKEMAIENNNEIHEIRTKLDKIDSMEEDLKIINYKLQQLNIHQSMTLNEVKGDR